MFKINVNGKDFNFEEDRKLILVLRNELQLKSVKDGCSEGACGTCTVLVDGKAVKACVQNLSRFEGKSIITVEGLTEREREVYVYAFGTSGAVQCGFCIPGMVMCAKGLLDVNLNPTRRDIANAIRNNICRCTGYKKIIDAIELAAKIFRENITDFSTDKMVGVGQAIPRIDVRDKVLGIGEYTDDMELPGMIFGSSLRSKYPRARVLSIDTSKALALKGVRAVLTAADVPGQNKVGHIKKDWDTMIAVGDITHYLGDAICLIAADTRDILEVAKTLIDVEYEVLEGVFSPTEALKENAPKVHKSGNILDHEQLIRGDAKKAIEESAFVVTDTFKTPFTEHAFLEPECAVAICDRAAHKATVYSTDQGTYDTRQECAGMMGWPEEDIHIINKLVGGAFGGKEDVSVQHQALLLAYHTGLPVKVKLSRQESILVHPKRHPADMEFTLGCDKDGILQGIIANIVTDTGAYASLGGPVLQRACTHAAGPYNYQNVSIDGTAVYTNNPPAGAFRGFGVTQSCFAVESLLNLLAEKAGLDAWEIRHRNAIRPGQVLPNGQIASPGIAMVETLDAVKDVYYSSPRAGIACALKNAGVGVGLPDWGRVRLTVEDGKLYIRSGASCMGQGLGTVLKQIACEVTKLSEDQLVYMPAETGNSPDSGTSSGSRQTLITGEACSRACNTLIKELGDHELSYLNGHEYLGEYLAATDPMGSPKKNPVSHVAYGFATQVVILDDKGFLEKVYGAHDVGRAVNPLSTEGQIEGGIVMGLGYALTESFPLDEGRPTAKYGTLGLMHADKVPEIISIIVEKNKDHLAFGAVGIGEITSIPTAPAVQGAYYKFDGIFRTTLPLEDTAYSKKKVSKEG